MSWFEYNQNNSGGHMQIDEDVTHRVFIEADTEEEAEKIAISKGIYFNGVEDGQDCECCGDRWSNYSFKITFSTPAYPEKTIEEYVANLVKKWSYWGLEDNKPDSYVYYKNGIKASYYKDGRIETNDR